MARTQQPDKAIFLDTLTIAAELAALRHDPSAIGRVVVALAQARGTGASDPKITALTSKRRPGRTD